MKAIIYRHHMLKLRMCELFCCYIPVYLNDVILRRRGQICFRVLTARRCAELNLLLELKSSVYFVGIIWVALMRRSFYLNQDTICCSRHMDDGRNKVRSPGI